MKTSLFHHSIWRKKNSKPSPGNQHRESTASSERSETPTNPVGRCNPDHEERRERTTSCLKQAPHRPPRPPSPNLFGPPIEDAAKVSASRSGSQRKSIHNHPSKHTADPLKAKRSMPELDGIWKGFLEDINEDHDSLCNQPTHILSPLKTHPNSIPRRSQRGSSQLHATLHTSKSTTNIVRREDSPSSPRSSMSSTESQSCVTDFDSLALFPAPPPLRFRKKIPKPLVLLPTATIAPLPPSPSTGSLDSTPVATPTTPTMPQSPRRLTSPPSILKKSHSAALLCSPVATPASPTSPTSPNYSSYSSTVLLARPPRNTQSMSNQSYISRSMSPTTHKSSSSDITAFSNSSSSRSHTNRSNTFTPNSRFDISLPPLMQLQRRQRNIKHPSSIEWGIAV